MSTDASVEGQLTRWREHFKEVLNNPASADTRTGQDSAAAMQTLNINTQPPSKKKIVDAIRWLKKGKPQGRLPTRALRA
jgi:hypothetical protein